MSTPKDKAAALEIALGRIEKDHGKGAVMRLGEVRRAVCVALQTVPLKRAAD